MVKRPLELDDFTRICHLSDPQISPNGKYIAFTLIRPNMDENKYIYEIWIIDSETGETISLLSGEGDKSPRWNPNSQSILFTSRRGFKEDEKGNALYIYMLKGEPRKLIARKEGISQPKWINETEIAFISNVVIRDIDVDEDYVDIRDIPIWSDGEGFIDEYRPQIFILDSKSGLYRQLTKCMGSIITWAPSNKGDKLAYIYVPDYKKPLVTEVHIINLETGEDTTIIPPTKYSFNHITWGPDDKYILLKGNDLRRGLATHDHIWIIPSTGGDLENLTRNLDKNISTAISTDVLGPYRSPAKPIWASDGFIYFPLNDRGRIKLYRIHPDHAKIEPVIDEDATIYSFTIDKNARKIAYLKLSYTELPEIWILNLKNHEKRKLTSFNKWFTNETILSKPIGFTFRASDGAVIDGWYIPPVKSCEAKKPVILFIHGGPKASYGAAPNFLHQLFAAKGYYVIYCNPRGSDGYSEEFADIRKHYGERDYKDIIEFVNNFLKRVPDADPNRMGVIGRSYGGFMVNWIITHTDMFKAAVSENGICDWISDYGTSDIGYWFDEDQIGGTPWKNTDSYLKQSPITYIENVKTPTLFIHSLQDYRCYIEQSIIMHIALKRLGKESRLIIFKKGSHAHTTTAKPKHRKKLYKIILDYFNEKLKQ